VSRGLLGGRGVFCDCVSGRRTSVRARTSAARVGRRCSGARAFLGTHTHRSGARVQGAAVKAGMLAARGEALLMMDADGATQVRDLERLEAALAGAAKDGAPRQPQTLTLPMSSMSLTLHMSSLPAARWQGP